MALIGTLQDNFNDNSFNEAIWEWITNPDNVAETNQQLELTTIAAGDTVSIDTGLYDLTGSQATIKVIDAGNQALDSFSFYPIRLVTWEEDEGVHFEIFQGDIQCWKVDDYELTQIGTNLTYNSEVHKYFRIREASGTIYWDYSTDGKSWTNITSTTVSPITITAIQMTIRVSSDAELSTTTAKVDDFNILPQQYTKTFTETVTVSESFLRGIAKPFVETATLSEPIFMKASSKLFSDTSTLSEVFLKQPSKMWLETITLTETFSRQLSKSWIETVTLTETLLRGVNRYFTETITVSEVFSKIRSYYRSFTDSITLSDLFTKVMKWMRITDTSTTWAKREGESSGWTSAGVGSSIWTKHTPQSTTHTKREDETTIWS